MTERIAELNRRLSKDGIAYTNGESLASHTTLRVGGAAAVSILPRTEGEALSALAHVSSVGIPLFVIGGGSNLLAPDAGFLGAVLLTRSLSHIEVEREENGDATVTVGAGVLLSTLSRVAEKEGLTGAEFLYGIPGTVGGAVVMNAGAYGGEIAEILVSSRYVNAANPSTIFERTLAEHSYGYRQSVYLCSPQEVVLSATIRLRAGDREVISREMARLLAQRREKQPLEYPSAGSFFKRPVGAFAGKLIEDCGLKGYRIGGAEVSEKHAGFLVNRGGATEADFRALAAYVREVVLRETGYLLESEVRTMGGGAP